MSDFEITPEAIITGRPVIKTQCKTCQYRKADIMDRDGRFDTCRVPGPATGLAEAAMYCSVKRRYDYPGECPEWAKRELPVSIFEVLFKKLFGGKNGK